MALVTIDGGEYTSITHASDTLRRDQLTPLLEYPIGMPTPPSHTYPFRADAEVTPSLSLYASLITTRQGKVGAQIECFDLNHICPGHTSFLTCFFYCFSDCLEGPFLGPLQGTSSSRSTIHRKTCKTGTARHLLPDSSEVLMITCPEGVLNSLGQGWSYAI